MKINGTQLKDGVFAVGAIVTALFAYKWYSKADKAVGAATDTVADWYVGLDGHVQFTDFSPSRLWRDQFDNNWRIMPEVYELYSKAYPDEINELLTSDYILKPEYRGLISYA